MVVTGVEKHLFFVGVDVIVKEDESWDESWLWGWGELVSDVERDGHEGVVTVIEVGVGVTLTGAEEDNEGGVKRVS